MYKMVKKLLRYMHNLDSLISVEIEIDASELTQYLFCFAVGYSIKMIRK